MQAVRHVRTVMDLKEDPMDWRLPLQATVEMRLEACKMQVEGALSGDNDLEMRGLVQHARAEKIASKYRPK